MGWKSQDYLCESCGRADIELIERNEPVPELKCGSCGSTMVAVWGAPAVLNHTLPAGTKRFDALRADVKMRKELSDAKQRGDMDSAKRISSERKKLNRGDS